jgi:phosphatidylserine/phosphatidylglycerophosphate/cardiolipin synthase-like enzyme
MIHAAQHEVLSTEFMFRSDEYGLMKLALLREKARQGVRVVMMVDAMHLMINAAEIYEMQRSGVTVLVYNDIAAKTGYALDHRDHSKGVVVDDNIMKVGDANTGREYPNLGAGHNMESREVLTIGPVARELRDYIHQMQNSKLASVPGIKLVSPEEAERQRTQFKSRKQMLQKPLDYFGIALDAPDVLVKPTVTFFTEAELEQAAEALDRAASAYRRMRSDKGWGAKNIWEERPMTMVEETEFLHDVVGYKGVKPGIDQKILEMFYKAKKKLIIISPYLILAPEETEAIRHLLSQGVEVEIFTNSVESSDNKTVQAAYEMKAHEIAALGNVKIHEFNGPGTWHAKEVIVDDLYFVEMGYNIDLRSKHINMETGQKFKSPALVKEKLDRLKIDRENFTQVAENGRVLEIKANRIRCEALFTSSAKKALNRAVINSLWNKL